MFLFEHTYIHTYIHIHMKKRCSCLNIHTYIHYENVHSKKWVWVKWAMHRIPRRGFIMCICACMFKQEHRIVSSYGYVCMYVCIYVQTGTSFLHVDLYVCMYVCMFKQEHRFFICICMFKQEHRFFMWICMYSLGEGSFVSLKIFNF